MIDVFDDFVEAKSESQFAELKQKLAAGGYSAFYRFIEGFKDRIRSFQDGEAEDVLALIAKAKEAVPDPGDISPAWAYIWEKLESMTRYKLKALQTVQAEERAGEWQVLIDNPYVNREVACYPGLTFEEAVYIYAQFRPELENNEYIRLQKIQTHLTEFGGS